MQVWYVIVNHADGRKTMAILIAALAVLLARIHIADVRWRIVRISDLVLLCGIRLAVLVIDSQHWGGITLLESLICALVVALSLALLARAISKKNEPALGAGDIYLYFVCCLFLPPDQIIEYLLATAVVGAVMALVQRLRGRATLPYAPAIIWPCLLFVAL